MNETKKTKSVLLQRSVLRQGESKSGWKQGQRAEGG